MGYNVANTTANSILLDASANIRTDNSTCDLGVSTAKFKDIYASGNVISATTRAIDNLITNSGTGTLDNICSFTSDKIIKDSGIATSTLSGGPFLPLAGTGSGNVQVGSLSSTNGINGVIIGNSASISGASDGSISIGNSSISSQDGCVALGDQAIASGLQSTAIGSNSIASGAQYPVSVGTYSTASGDQSISIGVLSVASASDSITLGTFANNSIANSCLIGSGSIANIRANSLICDLGTTSNKYKDIYASGNLISATTRSVDNLVTNAGTGTLNNICSFTSDKIIKDSGIVSSNVVTNTGGAVTSGHLVQFSGTGGRLITSVGAPITNYAALAGATFTGLIQQNNTTDSVSILTGSIRTEGGIGVTKNIIGGSGLNILGTTDSISPSSGTMNCSGGVGIAKSVFVGQNMNILGTTDSTSTTTGSLICSGGLGVAKQARIAGKVTISPGAGVTGLDLATSDSYSELRVIQNSVSTTDNHMYIGYTSGATSSLYLYSNNVQTMRVESGANIGIGGSSYGGGVKCVFLANATTVPTTNPVGGGVLYCQAGALKFRGSSGTVTTIALA